MNIKILGPGCARCQQLEKTVKEVVKELGIEATVEEVKDIKKFLDYYVMMTPGLVINEQVVSSGKVPAKAEVTQLIINAMAKEEQKKGA
ncbi:MAG: redox-active disulfide protein 2 [Chloroflexi bacterium RBG_13_50_10]|jgi:small redox-active disulfide protein 2|nr:MAG: redox-active disulfide protein 2 [Chloroflexi bacterium RBG_13_50_10]